MPLKHHSQTKPYSNQEEVDTCQVLTLMTKAAEEGIRRSYIQLDQAGNKQALSTIQDFFRGVCTVKHDLQSEGLILLG